MYMYIIGEPHVTVLVQTYLHVHIQCHTVYLDRANMNSNNHYMYMYIQSNSRINTGFFAEGGGGDSSVPYIVYPN